MFYENFRFLVNSTGKSTNEIADEIGMSRAVVNYWYNGKRIPNMHGIMIICAHFNCSADWLLFGDIEK